jgi:hypothetical protein
VAGSHSNGLDFVVCQYSSALLKGPFALRYDRDNQRVRPFVNFGFPGSLFFGGDTLVPLGKWTHVAMTYGGGFLRLYVNGVLDKEGAVSTVAGIGEIELQYQIGGQPGGFNPFAGMIDEVRLWNVVRTQQQIFNSQAGLAPGDDDGLIGYWRMQDPPESSVLLDSSSFGNHAQLAGEAQTNIADVVPKLASMAVPHSVQLIGGWGEPDVP